MRRQETIITKEDGRQTMEWWDADEFTGRSTKIFDLITGDLEHVIEIPDTVVLCDFCNEKITSFPVPVIWHHALCPQCFEKVKK